MEKQFLTIYVDVELSGPCLQKNHMLAISLLACHNLCKPYTPFDVQNVICDELFVALLPPEGGSPAESGDSHARFWQDRRELLDRLMQAAVPVADGMSRVNQWLTALATRYELVFVGAPVSTDLTWLQTYLSQHCEAPYTIPYNRTLCLTTLLKQAFLMYRALYQGTFQTYMTVVNDAVAMAGAPRDATHHPAEDCQRHVAQHSFYKYLMDILLYRTSLMGSITPPPSVMATTPAPSDTTRAQSDTTRSQSDTARAPSGTDRNKLRSYREQGASRSD